MCGHLTRPSFVNDCDNARLLHLLWQALTLRLLELLHRPRPTAADALDIVVLVNVLRAHRQALSHLLFHVAQVASRRDRILPEPILRPSSDALVWPTLLQVARLRRAIPVTNVRSKAMVRECIFVLADEVTLLREKSWPSVRTRHARNLHAWAQHLPQQSLEPLYEQGLPRAILPPSRTHHFEVDLSTGQNNKPPNLAVTPALLLACKGRRPHIAPAVSLVWGDPTLLEFASRRLARIEYGAWVLRANRVARVEVHTMLIVPLLREIFFHLRLRVDVSRLGLSGRERRLRDWR